MSLSDLAIERKNFCFPISEQAHGTTNGLSSLEAFEAILYSALEKNKISAASIDQQVQRTIAKQAVEIIWISPRVTGEILIIPCGRNKMPLFASLHYVPQNFTPNCLVIYDSMYTPVRKAAP